MLLSYIFSEQVLASQIRRWRGKPTTAINLAASLAVEKKNPLVMSIRE
jgi:hypothetical protein